MFAMPYSKEEHGDLICYLREHDGGSADNLFRGPEHFFEVRDLGLLVPDRTILRIDQSPAPDISYFVNEDFLLQSGGRGEYNMSCVGADEGIYDPRKALKETHWSIYGLDYARLYAEDEQ